MADLYLEEQILKIEEFTKTFVSLYINDSTHLRQLQDEFNTLSAIPNHIGDMIKIYKENPRIQKSHQDFNKRCRTTQYLLNNLIFKIHKQNYKNHWNSDFNFLYNDDENLNGTEIYIYDLKTHERTSTYELKSYRENRRLLNKISSIIQISNSHLLIMGICGNDYKEYKGFLMDLKTKAISEMFNVKNQEYAFDRFNQFIYYEDYLFVFGDFVKTGMMKYSLNRNTWQKTAFPRLQRRVFSVLFHNYVLISEYDYSKFYLYDLNIENHSELTFFENIPNRKFLFADQERVYLWMLDHNIYESDINNPFKWNLIGNANFGISDTPFDITFSNFEGNIYSSILIRPQMSCYKFNKERKEMELIYRGEVNR